MRPSKNEYYLEIAKQIAQRSTCFRLKAGAIIVKDDQIISTGYIGAPRETKDCLERGECLRNKLNISHGQRYEVCRSVHAEQNAIINAARAGVSVLNGNMYLYAENGQGEKVDSFPCYICKKMIINSGLTSVVSSLKEDGIKIFYIKDWVNEWKERDILDDKYQYGKDQNNKMYGEK
jgi:dCMP deaminase